MDTKTIDTIVNRQPLSAKQAQLQTNCDRAHPLLQPSINTHSVKKAFSINLLKTKHYSVLSQTQTLTAAPQTDRKTVSQ